MLIVDKQYSLFSNIEKSMSGAMVTKARIWTGSESCTIANGWLAIISPFLLMLATILFLGGCGNSVSGGGGGNQVLVANAGPDQSVTTGSLVMLNGSGSSDANGDTLTYSWSFASKPDGSSASLSGSTISNPSFTADVDGTYMVVLMVNDGRDNSNSDIVAVTAVNVAPVAIAGPDLIVATGSIVNLSASSSSDMNGDALVFNWSFTSKPAGCSAVLSNATMSNPTFSADMGGVYVLSLIVNDGQVDSMVDTIIVTAITQLHISDTGQTASYTSTFGEDHDYSYNAPAYTDNGNGTITDNVTGLLWQKQDDGINRSWDQANAYCSNLDVSGITGWRLPTWLELMSTANYGAYNPAINISYFPTTQWNYWSSTTNAFDTGNAWIVGLLYGDTSVAIKNSAPAVVRCVRGPSSSRYYVDNANGTVTDMMTGFMWQKQDDGVARPWDTALTYCEDLTLASFTDWRLPNVKELSSIIDDSRYNWSLDPVLGHSTGYGTSCASTAASFYWSSTSFVAPGNYAWGVYFNDGITTYHTKTSATCVRCVRGH